MNDLLMLVSTDTADTPSINIVKQLVCSVNNFHADHPN
jgi:hypothetical protein